MIILDFNQRLETVLLESTNKYVSSVAIVQCRDKYLLGLSTATDDRHNKWCFPAGHIKRNEGADKAAVREAYEETGIRCKAVSGDPIGTAKHGTVAFIHCKTSIISQKLKPNHEFVVLGWFKKTQLKGLKLHPSVLSMINKL